MNKLALFIAASVIGGLGGFLGSVLGNAFGRTGLFAGGFIGGALLAPVTAWIARWRRWIEPSQFWSVAAGAGLGFLAVASKNEFTLAIVGGIFVLETVSVIVQVVSFKLTGKRVFKMAPIHHHFEMKGWPEPKVIVRFWIISIMLALVALATLKLR